MRRRAEGFLSEALDWRGTRFCFQAQEKGKGADCLGLVLGSYKAAFGERHFEVPSYQTPDLPMAHRGFCFDFMQTAFDLVPDLKRKRGDVMIFQLRPNGFFHLGIDLGEGRFLHADRKRGVETARLVNFWRERLLCLYRVKEE